jgi:hypothetical protein
METERELQQMEQSTHLVNKLLSEQRSCTKLTNAKLTPIIRILKSI